MKRFLILFLVLFLNSAIGECANNYLPPLQPLNSKNTFSPPSNITTNADPFANSAASSLNTSQITKIEESLFGKNYANQNMPTRLSRIERNMFSSTYPTSTNAQRIDNIIMNFNQINKFPNISKNGLTKIESKVFNQSYPQNSAQRRIERLEEQMFGAVQSGNLDTRYKALQVAAKTCNNPVNYPNYSKQNGVWKNLTNNFSNPGGSVTGFTPSINPYSNNLYSNNNYYNRSGNRNNNYNPYSNYNTGYANGYTNGTNQNSGYGYNPYNLGGNGSGKFLDATTPGGYVDGFQDFSTQTGTGVTILD